MIKIELDEEDRLRLERNKRKKDMKQFQKTKEVVLDELLPKATGKDALQEKRKIRADYPHLLLFVVVSLFAIVTEVVCCFCLISW